MGPNTRSDLRVFLITANDRLRSVFPALLERGESMVFCGAASTLRQGLESIQRGPVNVAVSDMTPKNTADVLAWREVRDTGASLLMLSQYVQERDVILSMLAGATGHVLAQPGRSRELVEAIARVADGEPLMPKDLILRLDALSTGLQDSALDQDERKVLGLLAAGRQDAEIARDLNEPVSLVPALVGAIVEKLTEGSR